jgi:hypothetical protein
MCYDLCKLVPVCMSCELSPTHLLSFPDSINPWGQAASSYPHTPPHTCSQSYIRIPTVYHIPGFSYLTCSYTKT